MKQLEGASERLVLIKANLLELDDLLVASKGCDAIFHLASPVTDDPVSTSHYSLNQYKMYPKTSFVRLGIACFLESSIVTNFL